ncbi:UNVERIFIED_CONTAM: Midasin [Sesamum radiatum]|uniref:Midasin n=1 Tax=Sesamum radiatum TaxID=300843 RepID=A0AAW2PEC8_SESRA
MIRKLEHDCQKRRHSVKFEWVTGLLIKAIENGEWIVLENANLCNPTVLDRINSLVEQSGSITINECGIVEGKAVVLHPHPKFRMFLTVNPSHGEVSRAMRNRGVEIYLMQPYWLVDNICIKDLDEVELREVKRFIALSGIPVGKLVDMMAKAHLYTKHEGSHVDVSITFLELSRWVQLFQRLITNGNQPAWSIQISWEHTYLSSFGEEKGKHIVSQAVVSYLSMPELYKFNSSEDRLLCLPGGWPTPMKLRDYVSYSNQTYVRQNVMYLESVGSQIASGMLNGTLSRGANGKTPLVGGSRMIHLMDALLLNRLMFPKGTNMVTNYGGQSELELALAQKKLSFAADWAIEQADESDYWLYIWWFEWFGSRLQPFFSFFNLFSDLLKKELQHSIWTRIFRLRSELMSLRAIDKDSASLPLLSVEFVDLCPSVGVSNSCRILLKNSIKCVSLLRLSLQQWSRENSFNDRFKTQPFEPIEMKKLDGISSLCLNSSKSLVWAHGGHPILPSSADFYHKQCQLWDLCEMTGMNRNDVTVDGALFSHVELRLLAMQGICMSSYIIGRADDNDSEIIQQLEEMYQMFLGRLDFEKQKLVAKLEAYKHAPSPAPSSACCVFTPDVFSQRFGFDCWLKTQPIVDETSLCLDLELLQNLTKSAVVDIEEQHHATNEKISSFILELWFRWHATLWEACPMLAELEVHILIVRPVPGVVSNAILMRHVHGYNFFHCNFLAQSYASSLFLKCSVRKECVYLAGSTHHREADSYRKNLLERLNAERKRLQRKMVFRPNPGKFKELKHLCDEFLESVTAFVEWIKDVKSWRIEQVTDQVHNWQEITSRFIDRLSNEYSAYIDITEPVQVAIYEMKLGLSLVVSGVLNKRFACEEQDIESVLAIIYKFLRFPRVCASKIVSVNVGRQLELTTREIELPTSMEEIDMNMLRNIVGMTRDTVSRSDSVPVAAQASTLPLKVSVYHNLLVRIKDSVADARFLGGSSFKLLHEIFDDVASLWVKHRAKPIGECNAQQFKLRARAFKLESVIDIDVSNCANLLANDSFSEWQELLSEELDEKVRVNEEVEALEQDWNAQETDLDGIVNIHNQLFGSADLFQRLGSVQVSATDRLSSFLGSYMLGVKMTKGSFSFKFDAKTAPEHLLRLCLEHDDKFILAHKSTRAYNFYKDSNPPMMAKLVEPVALLKQRILFLLKEWDDHPALQKIVEVIDMILALPLETPLAKALSALEFLLNRVWIVQETVAKFPLSDQLQPIFALVSSWHKMEFESWPALLDEVQSQFERNAGKLWFPLYSVFQRSHTADIDQYNFLTIERHISNQLNWRSYGSPCQEESVKILYNTFGFYVQLLPRILEHIGANRRSIEKELNDLLKLCRWERIENYLAIENLKRTRLKLRKIIKKYTDALQQPLMDFLGQETSRSGMNSLSTQGQRFIVDSYEASRTLLDTVYNQTQSKANDSSIWFADWWKSLESVRENTDGMKEGIPSQPSRLLYWEERKQLWHTIENLCLSLIHCGELWEDKNKKLGKRRAFSDLLKLLDGCGLSKHRTSLEGQWDKAQSWLLKPSYEVQHLLLVPSNYSSGDVDCSHLQSSSNEIIWKTANKYYFKSIASIKVLEKICLNFHKDVSLIQVKRSGSYVDHLIEIQQEQRAVAYNFAKKLKRLKQCIWPLSNLFSSSNQLDRGTDSPFQEPTCHFPMHVATKEHLLLQTVENNHLNTCSSVKDGVEKIHLFIQKVLPDFQKSKNLLDHHLLGSCEDITMVGTALHPYGVTKEMEQLVNQNFQLIETFERNLLAFRGQEDEQGAVRNILLGHMEDLCAKAHIAEELYSSLNARKSTNNANVNVEENISALESDFDDALKGTYKHIIDTFQSIGSLNHDSALTEDSLKNIKEWKILFEKDLQHLQLDLICEDVIRTIQCAEELLNYCGDENPCASTVCVQLRQLYGLLEMVLALGDNILYDFLDVHSMVSKVTYALANIFGSLFANGFGTTEDQEDDSVKEVTQDANGTGMGEGAGLNDVSDQINDEDQLLGSSQQETEERDAMPDMPSKDDKGIEMEQDFGGETFSVSEDSEEDENEDNQDEQLESAMGEVGTNSDIVDEKLGDMDDDENENRSTNEKYEQGPSVKDKASQDEELRAKEDSAAAEEDAGDLDAKEFGDHNDKDKNEEGHDGGEDMNIDKDDAFVDPSGINAEDQSQRPEQDAQMDELETSEPMEDGELEDQNDSDIKNDEEKATEFLEEADSDHSAENDETTNAEGSCLENNTETDVRMPDQDPVQSTPNNNNGESAGQPIEDFSDTSDLGDSAPDESYANFGEFKNDLAPTSGQPNASELEVRVADTVNGKTLSNEQSKASLPPSESLIQKVEPNPCRSVGDALDGWKERVKVSVDLQDKIDNSNDLMDENADEYGYTAEVTEGAAQALGPATADQVNEDITQNDADRDVRNADAKDPSPEIETEKRTPETGRIRNSAVNPVNDVKQQQGISDLEEQPGNPWKWMGITIKIELACQRVWYL